MFIKCRLLDVVIILFTPPKRMASVYSRWNTAEEDELIPTLNTSQAKLYTTIRL
jgi:hypothetical protein